MNKGISASSPAIENFLHVALDQASGRGSAPPQELAEFDDCRYLLARTKESPETVSISFSHPDQLNVGAEGAVQEAFADFASVGPKESGYQLTLLVRKICCEGQHGLCLKPMYITRSSSCRSHCRPCRLFRTRSRGKQYPGLLPCGLWLSATRSGKWLHSDEFHWFTQQAAHRLPLADKCWRPWATAVS